MKVETNVILNRKRSRIISVALFIIGLLMGIMIYFYSNQSYSFSFNASYWILLSTSFIVHEMSHYFTYKYLAGVSKDELLLTRDSKRDIPYFKTIRFVSSNKLIFVLASPLMVTTIYVLAAYLSASNLTFSFLIGLAFALSGADIDIIIQIYQKKNSFWVSVFNEYGFRGIS